MVNDRIGRRRALMLGGSALEAAFVAACGNGAKSKGSGSSGGASKGLLSEPLESTARAKRGGVLKDQTTGDPNTLDIAGAINPLNPPARLAYSTLVRSRPAC